MRMIKSKSAANFFVCFRKKNENDTNLNSQKRLKKLQFKNVPKVIMYTY